MSADSGMFRFVPGRMRPAVQVSQNNRDFVSRGTTVRSSPAPSPYRTCRLQTHDVKLVGTFTFSVGAAFGSGGRARRIWREGRNAGAEQDRRRRRERTCWPPQPATMLDPPWEAQEMTVERTILLVVGVVVLGSVLLAALHDIRWLWLTGAMGAHLIQASFTGLCPVVMALKRLNLPSRAGFA
ncbi:YgaP family membrane protein [Sabulicella glaciei]|uniref:DUF2892 domain-containing protein n=1 Tax=Sabulicella glaciei TaxID=2984948 RepID=A0ABT3NVC9_9PROT|nr:DUF2892 domain-containing protein [Roseococcus sp. MDT2-1-1]MCW8086102.1 DUF2892 domain-containing protein [Roseococcus sp. MDT2-1-1]